MNAPHPATWAPGAVIPGTVYRVIRPLGSGGMGDVYEAEHELLGVRRAIKVLSRKLATREDLAERLRVEARALAALKHPNLVEVNDLGMSTDGRLFFAMELLVGSTLRDRLVESGPLKWEQALLVATQVLDALGAAHDRAMIHRDVKPENVFLLPNGTVKLLDFGIAKALSGAQTPNQLTAAGVMIGTPGYMSPEQIQGLAVDPRADLFAVGVLIWEMLVGRRPYAEFETAAALVKGLQGIPSLESTGVPNLPRPLVEAVRRATDKDPKGRFGSAAEMAAALRMITTWSPRAPAPESAPPAAANPHERPTIRYDQQSTSVLPLMNPGTVGGPDDENPTDVDREMAQRFAERLLSGEGTLPAASVPNDRRNLPTPTSIPKASRASGPELGKATMPSAVASSATTTEKPTAAKWLFAVAAAILVVGVVVFFAGKRGVTPASTDTTGTASGTNVTTTAPTASEGPVSSVTATSIPSAAPPASASASSAPPPDASAKTTAKGTPRGAVPPKTGREKSPPPGGSLPSSGL